MLKSRVTLSLATITKTHKFKFSYHGFFICYSLNDKILYLTCALFIPTHSTEEEESRPTKWKKYKQETKWQKDSNYEEDWGCNRDKQNSKKENQNQNKEKVSKRTREAKPNGKKVKWLKAMDTHRADALTSIVRS
jgi:hypothetical protein